MKNIYQEVLNRVHSISFETLWAQFKPYEFALYDHESVYFKDDDMPVTEAFMGNTTISYEGRQIAIWQVSESDLLDLDRLLANLVHEMFHAHQSVCGETRYFSDLVGLSYPMVAKNIAMKHQEFDYLIQAHVTHDLHEKKRLFKKFVDLREIRYAELGDMYNYEKAIETIEGVAEYIGLTVMRKLNQASYAKRMTEVLKRLSEISETFLDTRRLCYDSGALICLVADALNIPFKEALAPDLDYIYECIKRHFLIDNIIAKDNMDEVIMDEDIIDEDIIADTIVSENVLEQVEFEPTAETLTTIGSLMESYHNKLKTCIESVVLDPKVEVFQGNFSYCGYDPMNFKRFGNYVYHKYFLGVIQENGPQFLMGTYVTESETEDMTHFTRYYKEVKK